MAHIGAALGARHDVKLAIPVEYCRASGVLVFGFSFALRVRVMARARATRARARVGDRVGVGARVGIPRLVRLEDEVECRESAPRMGEVRTWLGVGWGEG